MKISPKRVISPEADFLMSNVHEKYIMTVYLVRVKFYGIAFIKAR